MGYIVLEAYIQKKSQGTVKQGSTGERRGAQGSAGGRGEGGGGGGAHIHMSHQGTSASTTSCSLFHENTASITSSARSFVCRGRSDATVGKKGDGTAWEVVKKTETNTLQ